MHTTRYITWVDLIPVWLGAGVACYFALLFEPPFAWRFAWAVVVLPWWLARNDALAARAHRIVFFMLCGFALAQWQTQRVAAPIMPDGLDVVGIAGRVQEISLEDKAHKLLLGEVRIEGLAPERTPALVRVTVRGEIPEIAVGDEVLGRGKLFAPSQPVALQAFDFARYFYFRRIGGIGFMFPTLTVDKAPEEQNWLNVRSWLATKRLVINQRIMEVFGADERMMFATALVTGDTAAVSDEYRQAMQDTGLMHVLSISGMHMAIIAGLVFVVLRRVFILLPWGGLGMRAQQTAAWAALIVGILYVALADFPIAAVRACIMTSLMMLAIIMGRNPFSIRSLSLAATLIIVVEPSACVEASFQLSFLATLGLVMMYHVLQELAMRRREQLLSDIVEDKQTDDEEEAQENERAFSGVLGLGKKLAHGVGLSVLTSLVASLVTMPLVAFHFHQVSLVTIFANLLTTPLLALWIMPALLLAVVLMPWGLHTVVLPVAGVGITWFNAVLHWCAGLSWSHLTLSPLPSWALVVMVVGLLVCILWESLRWRFAAGVIACVMMLTGITVTLPDVVVSPDKALVAVRDGEGWALLRGRTDRNFVVKQWMELWRVDAVRVMTQAERERYVALSQRIDALPSNGAYEASAEHEAMDWMSGCSIVGKRPWTRC